MREAWWIQICATAEKAHCCSLKNTTNGNKLMNSVSKKKKKSYFVGINKCTNRLKKIKYCKYHSGKSKTKQQKCSVTIQTYDSFVFSKPYLSLGGFWHCRVTTGRIPLWGVPEVSEGETGHAELFQGSGHTGTAEGLGFFQTKRQGLGPVCWTTLVFPLSLGK